MVAFHQREGEVQRGERRGKRCERTQPPGQHGDEPYDGLELVRLTLPRRVYGQEHLEYVADVVGRVHARRRDVRGLKLTYEPADLRFFQARFEPLAAVALRA